MEISKKYGANVKAITISKEQFEFASQKIFKEGINKIELTAILAVTSSILLLIQNT